MVAEQLHLSIALVARKGVGERQLSTHSGHWPAYDNGCRMTARVRSLRQMASALTVGVCVGVFLVAAFGFISTSRDALIPPTAAAQASFVFSLYYGLVIAALSVPLWLLISRLGLEGPVSAAGLGFAMTAAVWFFANQPFPGPTLDDLAIAICGSVAGLATWLMANRR